jgi:hypothetical protein
MVFAKLLAEIVEEMRLAALTPRPRTWLMLPIVLSGEPDHILRVEHH